MNKQAVFKQLWPSACKIFSLLRVPAEAYAQTEHYTIQEYSNHRESWQKAMVLYGFTKWYSQPPQEIRVWFSPERERLPASLFIAVICEKFESPHDDGWEYAHLHIAIGADKVEVLRDGSTRFDHPYDPTDPHAAPLHKLLAAGMFTPMMCQVLDCLFQAEPVKRVTKVKAA